MRASWVGVGSKDVGVDTIRAGATSMAVAGESHAAKRRARARATAKVAPAIRRIGLPDPCMVGARVPPWLAPAVLRRYLFVGAGLAPARQFFDFMLLSSPRCKEEDTQLCTLVATSKGINVNRSGGLIGNNAHISIF